MTFGTCPAGCNAIPYGYESLQRPNLHPRLPHCYALAAHGARVVRASQCRNALVGWQDQAARLASNITLLVNNAGAVAFSGALVAKDLNATRLVHAASLKRSCRMQALVNAINTRSLATRPASSRLPRRSRNVVTFCWSRKGIAARLRPRNVSCTSA
jgi:hypothetical protein